MKKIGNISIIVLLVALIIYVHVRVYQNYMLSNNATPYNDALQAINNPSFTIDVLPDSEPLQEIQTTVENDLQKFTPGQIEGIITGYLNSSYNNFEDYWQGN